MPSTFNQGGYHWQLLEGLPPAGAREKTDPSLLEQLKRVHTPLSRLTTHEIASWIIARLNAITGSMLEAEGNDFRHDTNEIGYKLHLRNEAGDALAHGTVMIGPVNPFVSACGVRC